MHWVCRLFLIPYQRTVGLEGIGNAKPLAPRVAYGIVFSLFDRVLKRSPIGTCNCKAWGIAPIEVFWQPAILTAKWDWRMAPCSTSI